MTLKNKVALITGAASGLGKAISQKFAENGAKIVVADLDLNAAEKTVSELKQQGTEAMAVLMDVTNEMQVEQGIEQAVARYGKIDVLISNAGLQTIAAINDLTYAQWQKIIAVHLDGAFLTTRACLKHMYANNS